MGRKIRRLDVEELVKKKKRRKSKDPYAEVRRDIPPSDFKFGGDKRIHKVKSRRKAKRLIAEELEKYFEEEDI